jgi:MOSC domain-containing protein YiiM
VAWDLADVTGTLRAVGPWWGELLDGRAAGPAAPHLAGLAELLGVAPDVAAVGDAASERGQAAGDDWARTLVPLAEAHLDAVAAAGAALRAAHPGPALRGELAQVNSSGGGVPKRPMAEAAVGWRGVVEDRQATRQHHGRVWQALSLWSADVIDGLAAEGHPVTYGSAGENLTITGVDWRVVRAGTLVHLGDEVVAEVSVFATPCRTIAASFLGRDFRRIDAEAHPGTSRVYASVVRPGTVRPGDVVVVEPA